MYVVRRWSVRNARLLELIYRWFEGVLKFLHPLWSIIGYERIERPVNQNRSFYGLWTRFGRRFGKFVLPLGARRLPKGIPKAVKRHPWGIPKSVDPWVRVIRPS